MRFATLLVALALAAGQPAFAQTDKPSRYVEAGIPAPSRIWAGQDYAKAANILASGAVPLPHYSTKDGADVLNRVTAIENLSFFKANNIPVELRLWGYNEFFRGANAIRAMYVVAASKGDPLKAETARLMAFFLYVATTGLELAEEFVAAAPRDELYPKRLEGLKTAKNSMASLFTIAQRASADDNAFEPEGRALLLKAMSDNLPIAVGTFTPDYKIELSLNLRADRELSKDPGERQLYDTMIKELGE